VILERRARSALDQGYVAGSGEDPVPRAVRLWQEEVHRPGIYDLEVDTSLQSSQQCAQAIRQRLDRGPTPAAFQKLAQSQVM